MAGHGFAIGDLLMSMIFIAWTTMDYVAVPLAFVLSMLGTRVLIRWLGARQFGKSIREDGPQHQAKSGTPTMGGLAILAVILVFGAIYATGSGVLGLGDHPNVARGFILCLAAMVGYGALGLHDDLQGLARRAGSEVGVGLRARETFLIQIVLATALALGILKLLPFQLPFGEVKVAHDLVPLPQAWLQIQWAGVPVLALLGIVLAIVGTVNGVNLADGLDGLAAGLLVLAFGALGGMRPDISELKGLSWVAGAACLGFLYFNRHPAKVFMGNVTSMGLGALLAVMAIVHRQILVLPILAAVFLAEVLSDIIQVGWFKWTRRQTGTGRRVFRMAPLHHHFEAIGWHETVIVRRFWAAGLISAAAAVAVARWIQPGVRP